MLKAIRYVNQVIPESNWEQKITDVDKYDIDVFVIGDDWKGHFDFWKNKVLKLFIYQELLKYQPHK